MLWIVDPKPQRFEDADVPSVVLDFNGTPRHGAKIAIHTSPSEIPWDMNGERGLPDTFALARKIAAFLNAEEE